MKQQRQNRAVTVRVASEPDAATNVGVKLPTTHVSASQNALKQIESSNAQGINSTCCVTACAVRATARKERLQAVPVSLSSCLTRSPIEGFC